MGPIPYARCFVSMSDETIFETTDADAIRKDELGKNWGAEIWISRSDSVTEVYEKISNIVGVNLFQLQLDLSRAKGLGKLTMKQAENIDAAKHLGKRIISEIGQNAIPLTEIPRGSSGTP